MVTPGDRVEVTSSGKYGGKQGVVEHVTPQKCQIYFDDGTRSTGMIPKTSVKVLEQLPVLQDPTPPPEVLQQPPVLQDPTPPPEVPRQQPRVLHGPTPPSGVDLCLRIEALTKEQQMVIEGLVSQFHGLNEDLRQITLQNERNQRQIDELLALDQAKQSPDVKSAGGFMSRKDFAAVLDRAGLSHAGQDVFHIIAKNNGGPDHVDNYLYALGSSFNRANGDRRDPLHCFIAGEERCRLAVAVSLRVAREPECAPRTAVPKRLFTEGPFKSHCENYPGDDGTIIGELLYQKGKDLYARMLCSAGLPSQDEPTMDAITSRLDRLAVEHCPMPRIHELSEEYAASASRLDRLAVEHCPMPRIHTLSGEYAASAAAAAAAAATWNSVAPTASSGSAVAELQPHHYLQEEYDLALSVARSYLAQHQ